MKKVLSGLLIISFVATAALAQDRTASFDAKRMIQRVKRLSADDFEGRGPGTDGGKRAAQYFALVIGLAALIVVPLVQRSIYAITDKDYLRFDQYSFGLGSGGSNKIIAKFVVGHAFFTRNGQFCIWISF